MNLRRVLSERRMGGEVNNMKKLLTKVNQDVVGTADHGETVVASNDNFIRSRIFTIRGVQVMLDRDLAMLYGVETKALNQAVKRNIERFPSEFSFVLTAEETRELVTNCDRFVTMKHSSVSMRAFSEHGVIMVASILKSAIATRISIQITRTFVAMRRTLASIAPMLSRIDTLERRQIVDQQRNEERFDTIFKAMDGGELPPQKVFFDGKHYDAYSFAVKLVKKATKSIVLIDGYVDETTLDILSKKRGGAKVTIVTTEKMLAKQLTPAALDKFNKQNPGLTAKAAASFHDRFMILDDSEIYHFGASLKDLGRKYCAVSKMDASFIPSILARI